MLLRFFFSNFVMLSSQISGYGENKRFTALAIFWFCLYICGIMKKNQYSIQRIKNLKSFSFLNCDILSDEAETFLLSV